MRKCRVCGGEMKLTSRIVTIHPGAADECQRATLECVACHNTEMMETVEREITQEKKLSKVKRWLEHIFFGFCLVCLLSVPVSAVQQKRLVRVYHVFAWSVMYTQFVHVADYLTLREMQTKIRTIAYPLVKIRYYEEWVAKFITVKGENR